MQVRVFGGVVDGATEELDGTPRVAALARQHAQIAERRYISGIASQDLPADLFRLGRLTAAVVCDYGRKGAVGAHATSIFRRIRDRRL